MSFSQSVAAGDNFTPAEYFNAQTGFGNLLLIYPKRYTAEEPTKKGVTQAADVDIIVVDRPDPATGQPLVFRDARIFGNLARSVRVLLEPDGSPKKYLGRLGQGPNTQGTPPWILQNWTDADVAAATPVAAAFEAGQFAQPTPNPMAPPQQPAAAAPPAPGYGSAAPQQQWQQPAAQPPQQQWQAPASPPPAQQQWQQPAPPPAAAPPGPPAAPAAAQAPAGEPAYDPGLVSFLRSKGVTPPPDEATARAIAASFQ